MEIKKPYIIAGSVLVAGLIGYMIYHHVKEISLIKNVGDKITDPSTANGVALDVSSSPALDTTYFKKQGYSESNGVLGNYINGQFNGVLTRTAANQMAQNIKAAYHVTTPTDQAAILTELQAAGSKVKLSYIAGAFRAAYGQSLSDFLVTNLDADNLAQAQKLINALP
jgi:hypothetical protein